MVRFQNDTYAHYAGIDELKKNECFLQNYNQDIVEMLGSRSVQKDTVLEFGAGLGTLALIWKRLKNIQPDCVEIDPDLRNIIRERGLNCYSDLGQIDSKYDFVYSSNVLEHIPDDLDALQKLNLVIHSGGYLAIYVPAFKCLYNKVDASVGHYRRYEKSELLEKIQLAGFSIKECHYVDCIGFFAWLSLRIKKIIPSQKVSSGKSLRFYDFYIYPVSKFLDWLGLKYIFGKNILVIAQKI